MYDSNGKKCDTMNHTTKMLLIAGCSAGKPPVGRLLLAPYLPDVNESS
jgi:hypothetical protein